MQVSVFSRNTSGALELLKSPGGYLLLLVIAFVVIPIAAYYFLSIKPDITVLALSGIAVGAYTVEAHKMRRELVRQNEISIMPFLMASIEPREFRGVAPYSKECLVIRNIGHGPALHIEFRSIDTVELLGHQYRLRFGRIDYLEAGKDVVVDVKLWNGTPSDAEYIFKHGLDTGPVNLNIVYQDVRGGKHETLLQMGKDGIRIKFQ